MQSNYSDALNDIDKYVASIREKQASEGDVDTTHPSKSEDDSTMVGTEGARSSENEADITASVPGVNINDVPAQEAHQSANMENLTEAALTGEDPANETSSVKTTKDDPGTTHPSEMDGTENKSASALVNASDMVTVAIKEHGTVKIASELVNMVADDLVTLDTQIKEAAVAGFIASHQKQAAEGDVSLKTVEGNLNKFASNCAANLQDFYAGVAEKVAEDMPEEGMPGEEEEGELPQDDLQSIAAMAAGPEAGGMPMEEGMPEGMPVDEAALAEEALGGGGEEEVIQALSAALAEAGVTPEELAMAVEAEQVAAPGPEVGGLPIEDKSQIVEDAKIACARVNSFRNLVSAGRVNMSKKASIKLTYAMRELVREATGK